MKAAELRKLIREEVKKAINEGPREETLAKAKSLVGKTITGAQMGTMGSIVIVFNDGTKLQISSQTISRDKDPNLTIG